MSLFKHRPSATPEQSLTLTKTTHLSYITNKDYRDILLSLYNSDMLAERALGSILNAVYTEGKSAFLLSVNKFETLIENDKSLNAKSRKGIKTQKEARHAVNELKRFFVQFPDSYELFKSPEQYSSTGILILDEQIMNPLVNDKEWCSKSIVNTYELISKFFQHCDNTNEKAFSQRVGVDDGVDDGGGAKLSTSPSNSLGKETVPVSEDMNNIPKLDITTPEPVNNTPERSVSFKQCVQMWLVNTNNKFSKDFLPELMDTCQANGITDEDISINTFLKLTIKRLKQTDKIKKWADDLELQFDAAVTAAYSQVTQAPRRKVPKTVALTDDELNTVQFYKHSKLVTPERPYIFRQDIEIEPKAYLKDI